MKGLFRSRLTRVLRLAFRPPIYLYAFGLGKVLGHRFLLFVHRGRNSGLLRETVLEVVRYDPASGGFPSQKRTGAVRSADKRIRLSGRS